MKPIKKSTGTFKSFDGTRIYFETRGEGEPLVLVYGIGCLINHWTHQIKYFSDHYQVIAFDYRGHHHSDTPDDLQSLTLDSLSQDLMLLLDHLKIEKAHFVGHSFGVQLLIKSFGDNPERFRSLSFINGFAKNPLKGMFGSAEITTRIFHSIKSGYQLLPETVTSLWKAAVLSPVSIPMSGALGGFNLDLTPFKDAEIYARGIAGLNLEVFLTLFENMVGYDGTDILESVDVPTLVIAGKHDSITPLSTQEALHLAIPQSQYLMVPYGSHCTQLDMPELVNLKIHQFLRG